MGTKRNQANQKQKQSKENKNNSTRKRKNRKKEIINRLIKDRMIRDIRTLFVQGKSVVKSVSNLLNNSYIEYESNGDRNRNL